MNEPQSAPSGTESTYRSRKTAKYWGGEIGAAEKRLRTWHQSAQVAIERFTDDMNRDEPCGFRVNLFHANVTTQMAMLYGNLPRVDVSRRFADANDDQARIAAEILQRMLNCDIEENGRELDAVLRGNLMDHLVAGNGVARVRYDAQFAEDGQTIISERALTDYVHWQDCVWGWCRNFAECPWIAYRSHLTREQATERFGEQLARQLEYKRQATFGTNTDPISEDEIDDTVKTAEVWEIWNKEDREVVWWHPTTPRLLDAKPDPLQLSGFFPSPPFLIANATTQLYQPTPDRHLVRYLYNEIDEIQLRISLLTDACRANGVFSSETPEIERIFEEGAENRLIPVDNWALFGERGGLQGSIDWVPLETIANTLDKLRAVRDETIGLLNQVTGLSDVMQGSLQSPYEGVGQSQLKSQYGSVRIQYLQDRFAQYTTDLMQLKAEIIARHFDPRSIARAANVEHLFDAQPEIAQAIQLIKDPAMPYRVTVRSETLALVDYARLKNERQEFMQSLALFLQSSAPMVQEMPESMPFLLQLLQWTMAGFKGANEVEGLLDQAIAASQQAAQQKQSEPDPQQQAEQARAQAEVQKIQQKAQADQQLRQLDAQFDQQAEQQRHQNKMTELQLQHEIKKLELQIAGQQKVQLTQVDHTANMAEIAAGRDAEMVKDATSTQLEASRDLQTARNDLITSTAQTEGRIAEIEAQARVNQQDETDDGA